MRRAEATLFTTQLHRRAAVAMEDSRTLRRTSSEANIREIVLHSLFLALTSSAWRPSCAAAGAICGRGSVRVSPTATGHTDAVSLSRMPYTICKTGNHVNVKPK